jgi:hypothetical protein
VDLSGWKAEGRKGGICAAEGKRNGERKGGARQCGHFIPAHGSGGTVDGVAPHSRQGMRERGRGGVSRPDRQAAPGRQRPEANGRGRRGLAMPRGRSE